ncbi:MAG: diaminopimelate epimerase [Candidatus Omnitrophica bacterium]|nr:diaminopimelate epimerase [Candidatus Omnitrophota bacterium]
MKKIIFAKMVASGNDFVVIESHQVTRSQSHRILARKICDRKLGIGADGLLLLEKTKAADVRMRIFNADGSEAQMCGNGARCTALYKSQGQREAKRSLPGGDKVRRSQVRIETKAGIIESLVAGDNVRIKLTSPKNIRLDLPVRVMGRNLKTNFIDTGVPHAVTFVEGLDEMYINDLGRAIRYHSRFAPAGTNADFAEAMDKDKICVRTYERGVEDETLACGTGSVAAALIFGLKTGAGRRVDVCTLSGETLRVYFKREGRSFSDVWLEGKARLVYTGVINV